ncbi:hypothetical protein AX16_004942 [Volvariella volvacea WC 439]|nr:hypothetical protein AX16_004942 [Volvariella volvacea WC 439]
MSSPKAIVRQAKLEEFGIIAEFARRAFIHDPVMNYFGSVKQLLDPNQDSPGSRHLEKFLRFLLTACSISGGRITVAVKTMESGTEEAELQERLVGAAFWMPPNKRVSPWKVRKLIRSGIIDAVRSWGFTGFKRTAVEYMEKCDHVFLEEWKTRGLKYSPNKSWYLQSLMVDPNFQGQGLMPLLIREAYEFAGVGTPFILEATTVKSRCLYARLGFEDMPLINLGVGAVDSRGIPAKGQEATGVDVYPMVNWNGSSLHRSEGVAQ